MRSQILSSVVFTSALACATGSLAFAQSPPGGFRETFALSKDRQAALSQLIPGTDEHYYFSCLLHQHEGQIDSVPPLLTAWIQRHGRTYWAQEIEARQALLSYDRDPQGTSRWLVDRMGLKFDWRQEVPGKPSELPTRLDAALLDRARLLQRAFELRPTSIDGLGDGAIADLLQMGVPTELVRAVLDRIDDPTMPSLVDLVVRELKMADAGRWGSRGAHGCLTTAQLQQVAQQIPALRDDGGFVAARVLRMQPSREVDLAVDEQKRLDHLEQLEAFAETLSPAFASLKAHVLFHRLRHDLFRGVVDEARLERYLRLPHRSERTSPDWLHSQRGVAAVEEEREFGTGLPRIGSDAAVVRQCFESVFAKSDSFEKWTQFVRVEWVRRVFAETKLLLGEGDMARWYALLEDALGYESIVQRVELSFPPTQPRRYRRDADVAIAVDVKNVPMLIAKLYRIDAAAFMRETGKEVDSTIELDGLVANEEQVLKLEEPPVRRVRRTLRFDAMKKPGVYVVELVGNGISSRAVIQKGALRVVSRIGAAGHAFSVFDEDGVPVRDAVGWCVGRELTADADGELLVPFAGAPGSAQLVVRSGAVAALHRFAHENEAPQLSVRAFVERESFVTGERCRVLIRPQLAVAGASVSLKLLDKAELRIVARTNDGVAPTQTVPLPEIPADGEIAHEVEAPRGVRSVEISLHGFYESKSDGKKVELQARAEAFVLNAIENSTQIGAPLLGRADDGWFLEVRGRNGELLVGQAVSTQLRMRDFHDAIDVAMQTDANGRVQFGQMAGVALLSVSMPSAPRAEWQLAEVRTTPARLHGIAGQTLRLPLPEASALTPAVASLVELRAGAAARDASSALELKEGQLLLRELAAGDYVLRLPQRVATVEVSVTAGADRGLWLVSPTRALRTDGGIGASIRDVAATDDAIVVRVANANSAARVHVFATRYQPAFDALALSLPRMQPLAVEVAFDSPECDYQQGRRVSDELRYVLERRYAQKRPGNMLPTPSLLLNPWELEQADPTGGISGGAAGRYGGRAGGRRAEGGPQQKQGTLAREGNPHAHAALDFLGQQPLLVANLRPDADGVVRVARNLLGKGQMIHAVLVDSQGADMRSLALPLQQLETRDLRLPSAFDADQPMAEQERIEFVAGGQTTRVADVATTKLRPYATLADAHLLLQSLTRTTELAKFAFVTRWPSIPEEERRALYREHACHELHLFLWFKDRAWFDAVLRPYLANKAHREFVDEWLLGEDLSDYLEPYRFARLNLIEQILLLKRLPGQRETLKRLVAERCELLPVDLDQQRVLFLAALRNGDLDDSDGGLPGLAVMPAERAAAGEGKSGFDAAKWNSAVGLGGGAGAATRGKPAGPGGPATDGPRGPTTGALPRPSGGGGPKGEEPQAPGAPAAAAPEPNPEAEKSKADKSVEGRLDELKDAEVAEDLRKNFDEKDVAGLKVQRKLYREPEATRVLAEQGWWRIPRASQSSDAVVSNAFWRDYAASVGETFVSVNLTSASGSFLEAMCALAVLDLPFATDAPSITREGSSMTIQPKSSLLLARSELLPSPRKEGVEPVLIRQSCFRLDDRHDTTGAQPRQKNVLGEFLAGVGFGSQIVITNPTDAPRRLVLLVQVPRGAMPLHGGPSTWNVPFHIEPFATSSFEFTFYFPSAGEFAHYPAHVSQDGAFAGAAEPAVRKVVASPTVVDKASWEHVSQLGSLDDVLEYLQKHNLQRIDLTRIAWRLRDRGAFGRVVEALRARMRFDSTVWSFGVLHGDRAVAREFVQGRPDLVAAVNGYLRSPLLDVDPTERRSYEHIEFDPLILARTHRVAAWQKIQNPELERQWITFVDAMCKRPALDGEVLLEACYYLLLQGRVDDAMATFDRIGSVEVQAKMQRDYLAAWFAFSRADVATARSIAKQHAEHPVERWRARFAAVLQQADEIEGAAARVVDPRDRDGAQSQLAATEPQLDLVVEAGAIRLRHKNLARCELRFHRLDIEFAFSASPFAQQGLVAAGWVEPSRVDAVDFAAGVAETVVPLPVEFAQGNVVVEARAGALVRRGTSLSSSMSTQVIGSYGQVEVRDKAGAPMPAAYVKCYARVEGGAVRFHKDGYTDLRGRFDYASVSEVGGGRPVRFSLLILSEKDGAVLREVDPPSR